MKQNPDAQSMALQSLLQRAVEHHHGGRVQEAEALYRQILQAQPRHPDALHLLGVAALHGDRFDVAVNLIQQALEVHPNWAQALCNLGNALLEHGRPEEAVVSCRKAIALQPDFAAAHCNLGNALLKLGQLGEAVGCYRQALRINPGLAVGLANLGNALKRQGRFDEAIEACRRAIELEPNFTAAYGCMADALCLRGRALRQQGQLEQAIESHLAALRCSDRAEVRTEFVQAISAVHFNAPHEEVRGWVIRALEEGWADAGELLTPATSLIECNAAIREAMARARQATPGAATPLFDEALLTRMAADTLLLNLLQNDSLNSIALERLLTRVRRQMLDEALAATPSSAALNFHCAIAHQCFLNEYVYACDDDEWQQLAQLHSRLEHCRTSGAQPHPQWLIASAAYAPLHNVAGAESWAALRWPAPLAALFTQQVTEPGIERAYRAAIPRLTDIEDAVSVRVRDQYEENPYPRWIHAPRPAQPLDVDTLLQRQFPGAPFKPLRKAGPLDVLVAGCGTGQHPIRVAQQFSDARVLAIDLSLASLSYAKRKTEEVGLQIEYAQADILKLGAIESLRERFDLIESAGVLHHLADPEAGLLVLLGLLRPGGLMYLGLYSELGRRDVVAARSQLAGKELPATASDIRHVRQQLMQDSVARQFEQFLSSRDFYATSACRDLLFHVQEHRYSVPQLQALLQKFGLNFIGFAIDSDVAAAYSAQFPDDTARTDLDHWQAFETARPTVFARMYQFWVQKP